MVSSSSSEPMDIDVIDTGAGDTPSVDTAVRVAFFGGRASYLERLGQEELVASVALVHQATSEHVERMEKKGGLERCPPGAKQLQKFSLIDECIRKLQQEVGPHLPLGAGHTVHQKPFSAFEEESLVRTSSIVQEANLFAHLQRPMLRPALVRLAGMANEKNSDVCLLCSYPVLEAICRNLTAEGLMALALSCTQLANTVRLDDTSSLERWRANLLLVYPPDPPRRGPRRSAGMAGMERLRQQLPYL